MRSAIDSDELISLLGSISQDQELSQSVEEAVRQGAVLPVLAKLGWNTYNIREVVPEYGLGAGRVDYCLRIGERKLVFVEVKRMGVELERHEKQLLEYAFTEGVSLAVLTNGLHWWLYLPLSNGSWTERRFLSIDLSKQKKETAAEYFSQYLARPHVADGTAVQRARAIHDSKQKQQLVEQAIPKVWEQILAGPDDRLLALIVERVEDLCGHRPDLGQIIQYLHGRYPRDAALVQGLNAKPLAAPLTVVPISRRLPKRSRSSDSTTRQRGAVVRIGNEVFRAESVRDLYSQVLQYLYDQRYLVRISEHLPYATSKERYLLAKEPYHPSGNRFVVPVEYQGYYMEAHKAYDNAFASLRGLLKLCNLSFVEDVAKGDKETLASESPSSAGANTMGQFSVPRGLLDVLAVFQYMKHQQFSYNEAAKAVAKQRQLSSVNTVYDSCTRKLGANTEQFEALVGNSPALRSKLTQVYRDHESIIVERVTD